MANFFPKVNGNFPVSHLNRTVAGTLADFADGSERDSLRTHATGVHQQLHEVPYSGKAQDETRKRPGKIQVLQRASKCSYSLLVFGAITGVVGDPIELACRMVFRREHDEGDRIAGFDPPPHLRARAASFRHIEARHWLCGIAPRLPTNAPRAHSRTISSPGCAEASVEIGALVPAGEAQS